jgi:hypothetical protein
MVESKSLQLVLGEKVIAEKEILRGTIAQYQTVKVPTRKGRGHCDAKLSQNAEVIQVSNCVIEKKFLGWQLTTEVRVAANIRGAWTEWSIFQGSVIGAKLNQVKNKKREGEIIKTKDSVFL